MRRWQIWLGFAVGVVAILTGLAMGTTTQEGWQLAARYTARAAFPLFIIPFTASALVRLYSVNWTRALLRERRWWGLGFAAIFALHLVALLVNNWLLDNFPPGGPTNPGVIVYAVLLAMVLTSTNAAQRAMGRWWKGLHRIGMWGLWTIFGPLAYVGYLLALQWPEENPLSDPYLVVCLTAAALKLAAWAKSRVKRRTSPT